MWDDLVQKYPDVDLPTTNAAQLLDLQTLEGLQAFKLYYPLTLSTHCGSQASFRVLLEPCSTLRELPASHSRWLHVPSGTPASHI